MRVDLSARAVLELGRLPLPIQSRMLHVVDRLARWPEVSGAKPLSRPLAGRYRMRTGDYRLVFRVEHERVVVERVGHRTRIYEE